MLITQAHQRVDDPTLHSILTFLLIFWYAPYNKVLLGITSCGRLLMKLYAEKRLLSGCCTSAGSSLQHA